VSLYAVSFSLGLWRRNGQQQRRWSPYKRFS
jgi:hypothetical protein